MSTTVGDQLSVMAIATLTALLLLGPSAARYMQQNTNSASAELDATDDPVDALAQLAHHGWSIQHDDADDNDSNRRNVVETVLKDVFQSKALQAAAQEFVVQILQSEPFQTAVGRLVKELWTDLVTDPETLSK